MENATSSSSSSATEDALLKSFFAEVSEVERDNEVHRILCCFKLDPFEHMNLPYHATEEDVKRQYRKLSLLVHPDKCKHPKAKEAFSALAKAQQLLLDPPEREYVVSQAKLAKEELRAERKKQLKKDSASKIRSLIDEISEEEGRLKKDEEEAKEMWKRKREEDEKWEETRENRVSSWRDFMKGGKKVKKGEIRPPKLKTEDPNKSYVQRPIKRG